MQQEFRALIRETAQAHPGTPPVDLARFVAKNTSEGDLIDFYEEALRVVIPDFLRLERNAIIGHVTGRDPRPSSKLEGIRTYWVQMLETQIVTADGWKLMGDCTVSDFDYAIEVREMKIEEIRGKIGDLHQLREHMLRHGAHVLRDAPEME